MFIFAVVKKGCRDGILTIMASSYAYLVTKMVEDALKKEFDFSLEKKLYSQMASLDPPYLILQHPLFSEYEIVVLWATNPSRKSETNLGCVIFLEYGGFKSDGWETTISEKSDLVCEWRFMSPQEKRKRLVQATVVTDDFSPPVVKLIEAEKYSANGISFIDFVDSFLDTLLVHEKDNLDKLVADTCAKTRQGIKLV